MIITAVGDIMPGGLLSGRKERYVSDDVLRILQRADIRIGTLETAIGNAPTFFEEKMNRKADVIYAKDHDLTKLQEFNINIVSLANNHFYDLGYEGAMHTIELLDSMGIKHVGAGANIDEAAKPVVITHEGLSYAFLGFCDWRDETVGWCPIATKESPGVNPLYDEHVNKLIKANKTKYDYVIAILHWGREYESYPELYQVRFVQKMVKSGAILILGGHTHSIQPSISMKKYGIAFSMGNFFFPDRLINHPRSTWYPESDIDINTLPITDGYPYSVDCPTLKIWKPIARRGLIVETTLNPSSISLRCFETYLDRNQYLTIGREDVEFPFFSFLFKNRVFALYCFIKRVLKSIKARLRLQ